MIKVYGLEACPDCQDVKNQIKGRMDEFAYFDLASETKLMKEYLLFLLYFLIIILNEKQKSK